MRIIKVPLTGWSLILVVVLILPAPQAWGYRPFIGTNAAVADFKEIEFQLGYFGVERMEGKTSLDVPQIELDYGILNNFEVESEFEVVEPLDGQDIQLVDPTLSLKAILKQGILQDKSGVSIAVLGGALLPSTVQEERKFGFQGVGILSDKLSRFTFNLNLGGGLDRENRNPFFSWGLIVELPITPKLRLGGEVDGEVVKEKSVDNSGLIGAIWQSPWEKVSFDLGIRKGISGGALDWQLTTGLTLSFSLGSSSSI
jgi:hypothetical protein